jgi:hypothetical protein
MKNTAIPAILTLLSLTAAAPATTDADTQPATGRKTPAAYVVVFDFAGDKQLGPQLADSLRLALRRHKELDVLDSLTTRDAASPLAHDADEAKLNRLLREKLASNVGFTGTITRDGKNITARIRCVDLRGDGADGWTRTFTDDTERARAVLSAAIVEAFRNQPQWVPPQYGDESEPTPQQFGEPLNENASFESGAAGWEGPDNAGHFLEKLDGRGTILRMRTDIERDKWLAYRRDLRLGRADRSKPPTLKRDTSYGCVGGLEGVHYRSDFIKARPGQRYWLTADAKTAGGTPKIFIKGFARTPHAMDGLPESSLAQLDMTPEQFAALPADRRKELIAADAEKHPDRYLRECYRWYLNLRNGNDEWTHYAAPFPPRGGLPENVEVLQIQVYAYWPPGEYLFDNVQLFADPRQKAPTAAETPRTPNFGRTSDVVERETRQPAPATAPATSSPTSPAR